MDTALITIIGVAVGWVLGLATVHWQLAQARNEAAHRRVTEALAPINDLLWDYALIGGANPVDLSPSRVSESELQRSSVRWHAIRPLLTGVAIGDPDREIRQIAGELGRAISLFTRALDRSDRSTPENVRRIATENDGCWELLHQLELRNLTRITGADAADPGDAQLDRLKGDRRFQKRAEDDP